MGDNNEKNSINFLPDDLKSKNQKQTSKKTEEVVYEPEMVRPDSEKLKKGKTTELSGSDVSVLQKFFNWFGNSLSFLKREKKEEKPRIQELQELVGKSQHVGEIMINDEEVLPDEERDESIKQGYVEDTEEERSESKVSIEDSVDKDKDKVLFITKEDHEKKLLREKDKVDNKKSEEEEDKEIASPQDISLHPNKDVNMPKSDGGIFTMPESLEKVSLDEPSEDSLGEKEKEQTEKIKVALEDIKEIPKEEPGPSLWDKIKAFFAGIFSPKPKEMKEGDSEVDAAEQKQLEVGTSPSALLQYASEAEDEAEDKSHVVSTPTEQFASGVKIMQQDAEAAQKKEEGPSLEDKPADFRQKIAETPEEKEELSKAQEELFSGVPDAEQEIEDIFSQVDNIQEEEKIEEKEDLAQEKRPGLWDKIKAFFAGIFAPKPKEIKETEERQLEEPSEKPEEVQLKPEEKPIEEPVAFSMPVDEGVKESLPKSLTDPDLAPSGISVLTPEVEAPEGYDPTKDEKENKKEKKDIFAGLKAFFSGLFKKKDKNDIMSASGQVDSGVPIDGEELLSEDQQVADHIGGSDMVDVDSVAPKKIKKGKQVVTEDELSSKFHQPVASTVERIIDEEGGVDLIPIAIKTKSWGQVMQLIIAAVVGSLIIVLAFYATLHFQQISLEKEKEKQQNQISDIEKKILEYQEMNEEIDTLGKDLATVNDLFSKHIYWTNLFALLEKYTLEDVYYSGFTSGVGGALTFSATGKDYTTVARQLKLLQSEEAKELAESVTINSITSGGDSVEFSVMIILNEDLFYYTE